VASVSRPLLELKGVAKVSLGAGERGAARFSLPASAFAFPGFDYRPTLESGRFELSVGLSADRGTLLTRNIQAVAE
jgi:beta-glucosidase